MKIHAMVPRFVFAIVLAVPGAAFAGVVESGDLNIINDAGNPSDGFRYLDMSFSDGLSLVDALANAQATYSNARLATPSEFDDLFAAAGITYNGLLTASDAFTVGQTETISSSANYDAGVLSSLLGYTVGNTTFLWSDPDGIGDAISTRDYLGLYGSLAATFNSPITPPHSQVGWLIVSEATTVIPEPSSLILACMGAVGLLGFRLRRKRKPQGGPSGIGWVAQATRCPHLPRPISR